MRLHHGLDVVKTRWHLTTEPGAARRRTREAEWPMTTARRVAFAGRMNTSFGPATGPGWNDH
jgi:hypothetical protein